MLEYQCQECVLRCVSMTVTVPKNRSAAAMDVDISVCLHIKVLYLVMLVYYIGLCFYKCMESFGIQWLVSVPYVCITEKPGACPKKLGVGLCVDMCFDDGDCPKNQKCCSNGCGHQCMSPYKGICFYFFCHNSVISFCHVFCMSAECKGNR